MAFDTNERSNSSALPVALYEFQYGTNYWRYSSDEEDTVVNGITYSALAIKDGGITMSGEPDDDTITITVDSTIELANILNGSPPTENVWVNIRRHHHGDDDAPIIWVGYIASRKQISELEVEFRCKMLTAGFDRDGNRLSYGRQCPHALYDMNCRVNKSAFATTFEVEAIQGNIVVASVLRDLGDGWLTNGFFEWIRFAGAIERRGIEIHSGGKFTILGTAAGLNVGDYITAYPGCQRTRADCKGKFNNMSNYGGFPHLPGSSPFSGDPVF